MNCGYEIKWSYDPRSYERNFCNCVKKPEKFRTSTRFEPVTSRYRCDALTNWAMKPLTLGAGHLWVLMFPWGMNQRWNDMWNGSYMNYGYEIKWSYDSRIYKSNFCNCVKKPEKFRTSTGFEPVTSRYRCEALPTELWSHWCWELVICGWGMNQRWNDIWNGSYMNWPTYKRFAHNAIILSHAVTRWFYIFQVSYFSDFFHRNASEDLFGCSEKPMSLVAKDQKQEIVMELLSHSHNEKAEKATIDQSEE